MVGVGAHSDCNELFRKVKDENDLKSVDCSVDAFIDPWSCEESRLVSLVSGDVASENTEKDMTKVLETGETAH